MCGLLSLNQRVMRIGLIVSIVLVVRVVSLNITRPNIVLFVLDDLGWSDVGYHGSEYQTPIIDSLAKSGVILDRYYTMPKCSPTRAAMLTGRYSFRTGLQGVKTIQPGSTSALPLDTKLMPELLSDLGYQTAMIGKWHQGYASPLNLPTRRGFESFKGILQGNGDYYDKTTSGLFEVQSSTGFDWWSNETSAREDTGVHNKDLYDLEFQRVLDSRGEKPLFVYFSEQLPHVPLQANPKWMENCQHIDDLDRRTYCGMMAAADESLGMLVQRLKDEGLWDNTILVVKTDNGGMVNAKDAYFTPSAGVNYPLRAGKGTVFEGGIRGVAFVTGGDSVIPPHARGTTNTKLLHAVDWLPTFLRVAGATLDGYPRLDGMDLMDILFNGKDATRSILPININMNVSENTGTQVCIIEGRWKLIVEDLEPGGNTGGYDGWYPPPPSKKIPAPENLTPGRYLFDLHNDPGEHSNLYVLYPDIVKRMNSYIPKFLEDYRAPQYNHCEEGALPKHHNGVWAPFTLSK